jgi:hypothetical protein
MLTAPSHDWSFFEAQVRLADAEWLRQLTERDRAELTSSLFNTIWNARQNVSGDWDRLDARRWQEKLELRRRTVDAFQKLDQFRRERSAANDTC